MRSRLAVLGMAVMAVVAAGRVEAQGVAGFEVGMATADGLTAMQVGVRADNTRLGRVGVGIDLTTFPDAISNGAFSAMGDVDLTYHVPVGPTVAVPVSAGFSMAGTSGVFGAGFNAGIGLIGRMSERVAVRVDYTWRHLSFTGFGGSADGSLSSLTIGLVFGR